MKKRNPEDIRKNINLLLDELEEANEEELKDLNKKKIEKINEVETYKKPKKGFVVSAVLYPLLVLFLAILLGTLSMSDTRKRILDKMKLEIGDSLFDDGECTCETLSSKLDYLLQHGVGGGTSYSNNGMALSVTGYETFDNLPNVGNNIGNIAVITDTEISNYYLSSTVPKSPKNGTVWVVQDRNSEYYITSDYSKIGISYAMQYICDEDVCEWQIKKAYVYDEGKWNLLYYVPVSNGEIDLSGTDINAEIIHTYDYKGEYQKFTATFSGYYQVELWGAQGGSYNSSYYGGKGAYTTGDIYLDAGETLYIYVGAQGSGITGGWNGGGTGYLASYGRGGGGATDIRLVPTSSKNIWNEFESLKSRIMVAAGGGGGDYNDDGNVGSAGGGLVATYDSNRGSTFRLTSQSSSGINGAGIASGGFGYGGNASTTYNQGANGGGSGYYGGVGSTSEASGVGGTSYISGHEGCSSIEEESTENNIIHNGNSYHYSGYYFKNTKMISGLGYEWKIKAQNKIDMPTYDGKAKMVGNSGNGYAKISLKTIEVISDDQIENEKMENPTTWNYTYSGTYQIFQVPESGYYQVELWGAQGGTLNSSYYGGKGAYTKGNIYLNKNEKLYLFLGNHPYTTENSYNGGGTGINPGRAGGGATDIRLVPTSSKNIWNEFESLKSRIMVAAGGGGADYNDDGNVGSAGGGLVASYDSGRGGYTWLANQNSSGINLQGTGSGGFGFGGSAVTGYSQGANGAGSGYYGGAGSYSEASGTGGSSYISGHEGCNSISDASIASQILHTGSPYHYSNYYFVNTTMIDGNGYDWTTSKGILKNMPTYDGTSTMKGNTGDGYAKITLVERTSKTDEELKEILNSNLNYWYYDYSGKYQEFTVPKAGMYRIELWGAAGYNCAGAKATYAAGKGAYTKGEISLQKNQKLYIYVGGKPWGYSKTVGGWNGGGSSNGGYSSAGGGATDIRLVPTTTLQTWNEYESLKSRIMVAASGSGADGYDDGNEGSAGGGLVASYDSRRGTYSKLASQTSGGAGVHSTASLGSFGYGGVYAVAHSQGNPGSGSGWYGGGGGSADSSGATGGSSYISGHAGCIGIDSSGNPLSDTYSSLEDSISYTGYKFLNTSMVDGNGYSWTTSKAIASSGMPSPITTSMITGNSDNGYAKITYLGE